MYIAINGEKYTCTRRAKAGNSVIYYGVPEEPPETEEVQTCRDDGFLLATDMVGAYLRRTYDGTTLTYTNAEEAQPSIEEMKAEKINQMSAACHAAITGGVDVELSDGVTYHFRLTIEDQLNMMNNQAKVVAGAETVPYHADGEECRYYSAADFTVIAEAATAWKLYQESYFNSLKQYILSLNTAEEIEDIFYGADIPEAYQSDVLKDLIGGTA